MEEVSKKLSFIETKQIELKAEQNTFKRSEKTHDAVATFVIEAMEMLQKIKG